MSKVIMTLAPVLCLLALFVQVPEAGEKVAARVNGTDIQERFVAELAQRMIAQRSYHGVASEETQAALRREALDELIARELQYQEARRLGLRPERAAVKAELEKIRRQYPSKREYRDALKLTGLTEGDLRSGIEKALLIQELTEKRVNVPAEPSEDEVRSYYDQHKDEFTRPESVHLFMISVKKESRAKEALARLRAGEDFMQVARTMSEDEYAEKGGDLGLIHRGRIYPELDKAAFGLRAGETTGLIAAEGLWFILKTGEKVAAQLQPYDDVRGTIADTLRKKKAAQLRDEWVTSLRSNAKVEILETK